LSYWTDQILLTDLLAITMLKNGNVGVINGYEILIDLVSTVEYKDLFDPGEIATAFQSIWSKDSRCISDRARCWIEFSGKLFCHPDDLTRRRSSYRAKSRPYIPGYCRHLHIFDLLKYFFRYRLWYSMDLGCLYYSLLMIMM